MTGLPSQSDTRIRAYAKWETAGRPLWRQDEHWAQAEAELAAERLAEIDAEAARQGKVSASAARAAE